LQNDFQANLTKSELKASGKAIKFLDYDETKDIFNFMEDSVQKIIELYKRDVDRTLIRENLKLTAEERLLKLQNFVEFAEELRKAGKKIGQQKTLKAKKHGD
jgi:hypothetical protein